MSWCCSGSAALIRVSVSIPKTGIIGSERALVAPRRWTESNVVVVTFVSCDDHESGIIAVDDEGRK